MINFKKFKTKLSLKLKYPERKTATKNPTK